MFQSDCCNEPMRDLQIDYEICPRCGEHCVVVSDERFIMNIWSEMEEKNIVRAVVYFDGGNDDGGVDSIIYHMRDGSKNEINHDPQWENGRSNSLEYNLVKAVYSEYTFLGQPSINGVLTYDLSTKEKHWDVDEEWDED